MILMVAGSRTIKDKKYVFNCLNDAWTMDDFDSIIHGNVEGVCLITEEWAKENNIRCEGIDPDWNKFGRSAGVLRSKEMVKKCDKGIAIWDGISKGTYHEINFLIKANKLLCLYSQNPEAFTSIEV